MNMLVVGGIDVGSCWYAALFFIKPQFYVGLIARMAVKYMQ